MGHVEVNSSPQISRLTQNRRNILCDKKFIGVNPDKIIYIRQLSEQNTPMHILGLILIKHPFLQFLETGFFPVHEYSNSVNTTCKPNHEYRGG